MIGFYAAGAMGSGGGGGGGDPYWSSVVACLNAAGADGSGTIVDDKGLRVWTRFGNLQVDDSLGPNTLLSDGVGDYTTTPYVPTDFTWWTTDHTIEAWVYADSFADWSYLDFTSNQTAAFIGNAQTDGAANYWSFGPLSTGELGFYYYRGTADRVNYGTVPTGQLAHIAMCHVVGVGIYMAIDGVVSGPTALGGVPLADVSTGMNVGQINNRSCPGNFVLRITKGVARYTSAYTPPPIPFPSP